MKPETAPPLKDEMKPEVETFALALPLPLQMMERGEGAK